jgi:hypothetical protein
VFDEAEAEYRQAKRGGYQPMPGLALLELARGDANAAAATIRGALHEAGNPLDRPTLLAAAVDIFRATGDVAGARAAADELAEIAASSTSEVLGAVAAQATGTVLLGEGDPSVALPVRPHRWADADSAGFGALEPDLRAVGRGSASLAVARTTVQDHGLRPNDSAVPLLAAGLFGNQLTAWFPLPPSLRSVLVPRRGPRLPVSGA